MTDDPTHGPPSEAGPTGLTHLPEIREHVLALDPWTLERQMELTAIPAPPFEEEARGRRMADLFREVGLEEVRTDEAGNVLGAWPPQRGRPDGDAANPDNGAAGDGEGTPSPPLVLSAHLDTIFPRGTDTTPRREGDAIRAPGITDDGRGLAALLTLARTVVELELPLSFPLLFVATVGEEGLGNLRGVRHLFREDGPSRQAQGFISLDGAGLDRIITRGVGSTRLRIEVEGPGGHSWADWGRPNPIHLLAKVVATAQTLPGQMGGKTTLTVARWGGGSSINAIPELAWIEVDLRSRDPGDLASLERGLRTLLQRTISAEERALEEARSSHPGLELKIEELGRRPAGATPAGDPLVKAALEATRALGVDPLQAASSTDANLPMSLGIPAITMGAGGRGGEVHTLGEWYRNEEGPEGILRALLTVMLLAG